VCAVGIVSLSLGALVLNAIKRSVIPDSAGTKGIYFKNFFPAVKALGEEGWKAQMDSQIG
jgi:hypothetical protein